jgi:ABC-type polysaccharide/polyol phosphate transport system ATPase subunit
MVESQPLSEQATRIVAPPAELLIEVTGVSKKYCRDFRKSLWYAVRDVAGGFLPGRDLTALRPMEFWAVKDVSFTLSRGDSLGLIGHNGAGKSTLLKMLTGQRGLTSGRIVTRGRVVALNELGLGFDPVLTGRENAYINAAICGVPSNKLERVIDAIIDFAAIREFIDSSVQTYSSGMKARLGFSIATHLEPDILIVDEVLAVGDLAFRRKCVTHIQGFLKRGGSMVLVAHDPYLIQTVCNRVLVMEKGRAIFDGGAIEGVDLHFQLGHASALLKMTGEGETGDGQTRKENWLTADQTSPEHPIVVDALDMIAEGRSDLVTGCSGIITLRCRSQIDIEVGWGFTIFTADLTTAISTFALGLDGRSVMVERGENEFRCRIPNLPLRPGTYAIRGGIADKATLMGIAVKGYEDAPSFFTVKSEQSDRTGNFQSLMNDLVEIPAEWL